MVLPSRICKIYDLWNSIRTIEQDLPVRPIPGPGKQFGPEKATNRSIGQTAKTRSKLDNLVDGWTIRVTVGLLFCEKQLNCWTRSAYSNAQMLPSILISRWLIIVGIVLDCSDAVMVLCTNSSRTTCCFVDFPYSHNWRKSSNNHLPQSKARKVGHLRLEQQWH